MNAELIQEILRLLQFPCAVHFAEPFRSPEDGSIYPVWHLVTDRGELVLKQASSREASVYRAFFLDGRAAPHLLASGEAEGQCYILMEYVPGHDLCRCSRRELQLFLDALIEAQEKHWADWDHRDVGYSFASCWENRQKRSAYMGELGKAYQAYLDAFATLPRTLCNDDMLPFNVLVQNERAVILDWDYGGILPYPSPLARFLAFGEENENALFYLRDEDRQFALDYYFMKLPFRHGISREEFDRTMDLFFFKEYSEWVYCAGISGDYEMEYYKKYAPMARRLAESLGYL